MESCVKKIMGAWPKPFEGEVPTTVSSHESAWASALAMYQEAGCKTLEVKTRAHGIVRSERLNHDKPATDVIVSIEEEVAATITTESVQ